MNLLADTLTDPDFVTGDYTVTRQGAPTVTAGVDLPGATSTLQTGAAALHPSTIALEMLPEGHHVKGAWVLFTTTALLMEPVPDKLATPHGTLAVADVRPWTGHGGTFYVVGLDKAVVQP